MRAGVERRIAGVRPIFLSYPETGTPRHLPTEWSDHIEHDLVTPDRDSEGSERLLTLL